jgi:hypothetical protein
MNELETRQAWFFDGALDSTEAEALARDLELDPQGVREFIGSYRVDRLLAAKFQPPRAEAIDAIMAQVRRENHPFVQSVLRGVRALPPRTTLLQHAREWIGRYRGILQWTLASATVVVLALSGVWLFGPTIGDPMIAEATAGGATLERAGQTLLVTVGIRVRASDSLRTGTNAVATITFGAEHTRLELRELTELKLTSLSRGKQFELKTGKVEASIARQRPFSPMILTTPQAEARVLGTRFILSVTTNATRLDVAEGNVRFTRTRDLRAVRVAGGHYAVAAPDYELLALPMAGGILREFWRGVSGKNLRAIEQDSRFPDHPDGSDLARTFELEPVQTNKLLVRFRGYLHPPVTGDYEFWLAGANAAQLLMSPTELAEDTVVIAQTSNGTQPKAWDAPRFQRLSQWAPPLPLVAGRRYYIEGLVLIRRGEGHLSVAWKGPGRPRELLTAEFLSPAEPKK